MNMYLICLWYGLLCTSHLISTQRNLYHVAQTVLFATHKRVPQQQRDLLLTIKNRQIPHHQYELHMITAALSRGTQFPLITQAREIIDESINVFAHVPGFATKFKSLITALHNEHFFKGYLYELEKALAIAQAIHTQEYVERFEKILHNPHAKQRCRIDIATNERLIECKNINWKNAVCRLHPKSTSSLQEQFLTHQYIINAIHTSRTYAVSSKKNIPKIWREWFDKYQIAYEEDTY